MNHKNNFTGGKKVSSKKGLVSSFGFLAVGALLSIVAQAQSVPSFDHTAACIAVLKPKAAALAARYRAGDDSVKADLINLTETSFALVGVAYDAGLREDEANMLLASAAEFQTSVPAQKLASLATLCQGEGHAVLGGMDAAARAKVASDAAARVKRIREEN